VFHLFKVFRLFTKACTDTFASLFYSAKYLPWFVSIPFAVAIYVLFFLWLVPGLGGMLEGDPGVNFGIGAYIQSLLLNNAEKVIHMVTLLGYGLVAVFAVYGALNGLRELRFRFGKKRHPKKEFSRRGAGAGGRAGAQAIGELSGDEKLLLSQVLTQAGNWQSLQDDIEKLGLQLCPKGSGFALYRLSSGQALGSLSGLGLGVSFVTLKRRLGTPPANLTPTDMGVR
jgi:hypothetical protein